MLKALIYFNLAVVLIMTAAYFYQVVYTFVGLLARKGRGTDNSPAVMRRYAALICARNESAVIAQLVKSLKRQKYPAGLLDIYVLADNCTDDTFVRAQNAGAIAYRRFSTEQVGKGYALDYLLRQIRRRPDSDYAGYFVFDADNIVDPNFVSQMNRSYSKGYDVLTCYRNSKNFGANWISACYSIWFLREARFLNYPRMLLGSTCAVSGTGFFVSSKLIDENGGWPFHMLTEDIQFSANCALKGHRIGYCDGAVVYDEQPTTFSQSWDQRLRWSKGFYQVNAGYSAKLIKSIFSGKGRKMSCYDILMTIAPATLLTLFAAVFNLSIGLIFLTQPGYVSLWVTSQALRFALLACVNFYIGLFLYGTLTVISEWKRIHAPTLKKLMYIPAFPIFMATYIPIAVVALFRQVKWKPIRHYSAAVEKR